MKIKLNTFAIITAILSSLTCLFAGIWIIANSGWDHDNAVWTGMGLYFIGKSFFVGPMLIITALR